MLDLKLESFEQLLQDFYNLTGLKTCLFDSERNELCYFPSKFNRFCEILRRDSEMNEKCKNCDDEAFANCLKTRSQYVYTCHAGLQECISPIVFDNQVIGFIMLGQIKNPDSSDFNDIAKKIPPELFDELKPIYDNLFTLTNQELSSAFRILDACTGYELFKDLIQTHNVSIDSQIDKYIHENLAAPISVLQLCEKFHLSRQGLYNIFAECFRTSPAKYINELRLSNACKLLIETDLPVYEIAVQCGVPDYNYFSKIFKNAYKMSPTKYRSTSKNQK